MIEPTSITESAPGIWTIVWDEDPSSEDSADVWLYGIRIAESVTTGMVSIQHPLCPPVELVEANAEAEQEMAGPVGEMCWHGVAGAGRYVVQRRLSGETTWRSIASVLEEGRGHYHWRGRVEPDGSLVEYRVVVERMGTDVEGEVIQWLVVRHPSTPLAKVTVVAGPKLRVVELTAGGLEV